MAIRGFISYWPTKSLWRLAATVCAKDAVFEIAGKDYLFATDHSTDLAISSLRPLHILEYLAEREAQLPATLDLTVPPRSPVRRQRPPPLIRPLVRSPVRNNGHTRPQCNNTYRNVTNQRHALRWITLRKVTFDGAWSLGGTQRKLRYLRTAFRSRCKLVAV